MRNDLRGISYPSGPAPSHFALAYDAWAPVAETGEDAGKVPVKTAATGGRPANERFREQWLAVLEDIAIDGDYVHAFGRWEKSLKQSGAVSCEIALASRLLVGHGNASATEVGLTVHHTWGVPMIPGSALKGLCAHYTAATYGAKDSGKTGFAGPEWEDEPRRRIEGAPGDYYRALFGVPDVDNDASAGLVIFHDALYVPGGAPGTSRSPWTCSPSISGATMDRTRSRPEARTPSDAGPTITAAPTPWGSYRSGPTLSFSSPLAATPRGPRWPCAS
jgi:CRISPR-associated protein Cmr6